MQREPQLVRVILPVMIVIAVVRHGPSRYELVADPPARGCVGNHSRAFFDGFGRLEV